MPQLTKTTSSSVRSQPSNSSHTNTSKKIPSLHVAPKRQNQKLILDTNDNMDPLAAVNTCPVTLPMKSSTSDPFLSTKNKKQYKKTLSLSPNPHYNKKHLFHNFSFAKLLIR
jgi:hypothetical protein